MDLIKEDNFFMVLPSDSNLDTHPQNIISNFIVQLPRAVTFEKPMECAISEIIIPGKPIVFKKLTIHLVYSPFKFSQTDYFAKKIWNFNEKRLLTITIKDVSVTTYKDLCKIIFDNYKMLDLTKDKMHDLFESKYLLNSVDDIYYIQPEIEFDKILSWHRGFIGDSTHLYDSGFILYWKFDKNLHKYLGFTHDQILNIEKLREIPEFLTQYNLWHHDYFFDTNKSILQNVTDTTTAIETNYKDIKIFPDINFIDSHWQNLLEVEFYIFTNIVKNSFINNVKKQILQRTICSTNILNIVFNPPVFIPLNCQEFDSIHIKILDKRENLFIFENGRVIITLIFRHRDQI